MNLKRDSNFELLRIICMLMIITGHTFMHGGVLEACNSSISSVIHLIYAIILVEVNCFILLTGYFQSKSKFKMKKFVNLLCITYFYKILITTLGFVLGWFDLSKSEFLWQISPFDFSNYWFIKIYLILYCLSPFINKFIQSINRKTFRNLLIVIFIFCSLLVTLTNQQLFTNSSGYSLVQFVFMYLIGAYLREYVINDKIKEKIYKNKKALVKKILIAATIFIACFIINYILFRVGNLLMEKDGMIYLIGNRIKSVFMNYDNPLVVIGSVSFFLMFSLLKFKSKFINILSAVVFPIYLIHETDVFRPVLYSWFGLNKLSNVSSYKIFIWVAIIVLTIFIGCVIIDYMRKFILFGFNKIINYIKSIRTIKEKYSLLCDKIDAWMNV